MARRIVAFIIFLIGAGILFLGMLKTNLACNKTSDQCILRSSIPALHLNLDSMQFKLSDLKDITCERRTQASRGSGRRAYYELTLNINNEPYVLETCPNRKICRRHVDKLLDFKHIQQYENFDYKSAIGVSNVMGVVLGAVLIILGWKMFFDKAEETSDEISEDDK